MNTSAELAGALAKASHVVARVAAGHSLAAQPAGEGETGPMRGAIIDISYGTLRRYGRGDALLDALAHRGTPDAGIRALLLCALYAIESGGYPEHVAVDQAVRACAVLKKPAAKGFVNAVLREFLRERTTLDQKMAQNRVARAMHPDWWIGALQANYPRDWEAILDAGNRHPPMGLRINCRRTSIEGYLSQLERGGMTARRSGESALLLEQPVPVHRLPGFAAGEVSVQDAGAQRAAELLDLADGQRVLDACAAPGGKACHILERAAVDLLALDTDGARCERIRQNLARLGLAARVEVSDCTRCDEWWDGRPFDRVLADVPCTGSGIARRHPDIKWLRRSGDPARFAALQAGILDALWRVLAPGGKLLYATCSVFAEENSAVTGAFCARQGSAHRLALPGNVPAQLLPGAEHDGFFYALLQKRP